MERVDGVSVGGSVITSLTQDERNTVFAMASSQCICDGCDANTISDCRADHRSLFARALRFSRHADRSELDKLLVERADARGRTRTAVFSIAHS